MANGSDIEALENFLMDDDLLSDIESHLDRFNTFDVLRITNNEIRHSNVLAWLLNPNENHGLGDAFLKRFMQAVLFHNKGNIVHSDLSLIDISLFDYSSFSIRREWHNIDLLILSEDYKFLVVLEHKIGSGESEHQLNKYRRTVCDEYSNYHKVFLFLAATRDLPSDNDNWVILDYSFIVGILSKILGQKAGTISESARLFIEQYLHVLRREIVGDEKIEKICREIYSKHQKALDLIFEYRPDIYLDVSRTLERLIDSQANVIKDSASKAYVRFTTSRLEKTVEKRGKEWVPSQRILIFEIQNKNEKIAIKLIIGPGDDQYREMLFKAASESKGVLNSVPNSLGAKWTQIYTRDILVKGFIEKNQDNYEAIEQEIRAKMKKFFSDELPAIEEAMLSHLS